LPQNHSDAYLWWLNLAEEAVKRHDYETAARFYRYVSVHFGLLNDLDNLKKFAIKSGECYFNAGQKLWNNNKPLKALLFYIKASNCFKEGGDDQRAKKCDLVINVYYDSIRKGEITESQKDAYDLKRIGDYFATHNLQKAIKCYEDAAKKAFEDGKLNLSGSLYGILGECYMTLGKYEAAAENYARSADIHYECGEPFEAAWRYCISGFHFILAGRTDKALSMASRAESICREEEINVILNDLASICRLLSEGSIHEAKRRWSKIRMKLKKNYVKTVDSCFRSVNFS